ncbi:hypothetical protein B296_00045253, partial [Ensete ventricosum]
VFRSFSRVTTIVVSGAKGQSSQHPVNPPPRVTQDWMKYSYSREGASFVVRRL